MDKNTYEIMDKLIDSTNSITRVIGGLESSLKSFPKEMEEKIKGVIIPILENQESMAELLKNMKDELDFKKTVTETLDIANRKNNDKAKDAQNAKVEIVKSNNNRKQQIWTQALTIIGSVLVSIIGTYAVMTNFETKKLEFEYLKSKVEKTKVIKKRK